MNAWASLSVPFAVWRRFVLLAVLCLVCGRTMAQAASADYTDDLPTVARVEAEIKGKDPTDSLARQVAVFNYLYVYVDRIKSNRSYAGPYTPGEQRVMGAYRLASYQISQDYAKTHTADEAKAFERLHGQYEMDSDFYKDWSKRLIGPQSAAAYKGAEQGLGATQRAHVAQEQQQYQQDVAAQQAGASGMSGDPTAVATRRCLELGGDAIACMGKGLANGLISMVTGGTGLSDLTGPGRAGVVLIGNYRSSGSLPTINFSSGNASIVNCGKLADDSRGYTVEKSGGSVKLVLSNEPSSIVLSMRSDGSLTGPGLITVSGHVISGYEVVTSYKNGVATGSTRTPVYKPATDRCSIGTLTPPPPAPPASAPDPAASGGLLGGLMGMMGTVAPPDVAGLRIIGKYFSSTGLILDFAGDAVTMDCGQAHIKAPYTVVNSPTSFTVSVQNPSGPFHLAVTASNTLQGSGTTTVNGRLVSGMNGDNVSFTPRSESCAVATFTAQDSVASSSISAGASPVPAAPTAAATPTPAVSSPSATGMTLVVTSSFPIAKNPLAGRIVKLMTERFDKVLRTTGAPIPVDITPGQALQAYSTNCPPPGGCPAAAAIMHPYFVGTATFDSDGKATLTAPVPPGSYYVIASVNGTAGALVWDLPVTLKAGDNAITFTATNAELVH